MLDAAGLPPTWRLDWRLYNSYSTSHWHYNDVIMSAMTSQITSITIVFSTVYSDADQRKHQSSASLAFVRGLQCWPVNSPHKGLVTRKIFPFHDVIMESWTVVTIHVCIHIHESIFVMICSRLITHEKLWHNRASFGHYSDIIMSAMAFQVTIVFSTFCQAHIKESKNNSVIGFMGGIHRSPVDSPHKWPVTRKMFSFEYVLSLTH